VDASGDPDRLASIVQVFQENGELVAAEPRDSVAGPNSSPEPVSDVDQRQIADVVPPGVVDRLEAIEVEEHHGDLLLTPGRPGQRVLNTIPEQRPVGQIGQRIVQGLLLVHPPAKQIGDAGGRDEDRMDPGPEPGILASSVVVVRQFRKQHAGDAVLEEDEADGDEEDDPVLIERNDRERDEVVEMKLDQSAGEVDHDG
jgi:hypothetical protein